MAEEIKGIIVEIGGDTSKLSKALKTLNAPISETQKELQRVEQLLKLDPKNAVALTQKHELLNRKVEETQTKLSALKRAKETADRAMQNGTQINQQEYRELSRQIELTANNLKTLTKETTNFSATGEKIKAVAGNVQSFADKATQAIKPVAVAVAAVGGASAKVGMEYTSQMSKVQAISGATAAELKEMKAAAAEVGKSDMPQTATQAGQAMEYMALAGWSVQESISELPNILNLSVASGLELGATSDIITDYLSAFNMKTDEAAHLADVMAYAQSNANTNVEQLAGAYRNCAANANAMGYSVEDVTADLSMMANQGLKGEKAGTTLSAVYRDITKKMKDGKIAINGVNIAVQDQNGNYRKLSSIVKDVAAATDGMGDAQKNAALLSIFTSDSIKGLNLLLNAGGDASEEFAARLEGSTGAASTAAKTMSDNLAGDIESLKGKLEVAGIQIFEVMEEPLRAVVSGVGTVVDKFTELDAETQKLIVTAGAVVAGAPIVTAGISGIAAVVGTLATPVGAVVAAVGAVTIGISALALAETAEEKALREEREERKKHIEELDAEAESIAAAKSARKEAIASATVEATKIDILSTELRTLVDANGKVKEGYEDRANYIINELNNAFGTEYRLVDGQIQKWEEFNGAIDANIAKMQARSILATMETDYTAAITSYDDYVQRQVEADKKLEKAKYNLSIAQTNSAQANQKCVDAYKNMGQVPNSYIEELIKVEDALDDATSEVERCSKEAINANNKVQDALATITDYENISTAVISGDAAKIVDALGDVITSSGDLTDALKKDGDERVKATDEELNKMIDTLDHYLTIDAEKNQRFAEEKKASIKKTLAEMADAGLQMSQSTATKLKNAGFEISDSIVVPYEEAQNRIDPLMSTMLFKSEQWIGKTMSIFAEKSAAAKSSKLGGDLAAGYSEGIEANAGAPWAAATTMTKGTLQGIATTQESNSPSKVTHQYGIYFAEGFANGITAGKSKAVNAAVALAKAAITAAKNTAKIHSPSVVMRDEVGKMLALGLAEGIKRNSDSAVYAAEAMNDKLLTVTKLYLAEKSRIEKEQDEYDEAERLKSYEKKLKEAKDAEAKQKVIEEEQQRQREQQRKNEEEQQKEYLDKLKELAEASEKQAKSIVETYADMANEVYDDLNDVINAIDSMNNKLNSYGNDRLFTKSTFSDKDGNLLAEWYNLEDISKYTESLKEYGELLYRVKERGADREIFEHLRDMDVDEGITFAQLLLDADDDEFRKYNEQWEQRREASRLIAEALYKDEAEAIRDELLAVLSESTQQFQQYGITAADEYYEGFKTAIDKIKNLFGEISMGQNLRLSYGITGMETGESSASASISISQSFYGDVSPSEAAAETERAVNRITVLGQLGAV